jgi:hypothetical protein
MNEIDQLTSVSVQKPDVTQNVDSDYGVNVFQLLLKVGETIPAWWSPSRDIGLREFARKSNYLAGTIYALVSSMTTIPFMVIPRDNTIQRHVDLAQERTYNLINASHFYNGWNMCYGRFVYDYLTQDNGAFLEVIGDGPKDGPVLGLPLGLANLDSSCCARTSNPEYPVIFHNVRTGDRHKLHYTRVIHVASLPSTDARMNGVGLSACSRAIDIAQVLYDITMYKQQKLGSRPERSIIYGNISGESMKQALKDSEMAMDNRGLTHYSNYVLIGSQHGREIKLDKLDLASIPDGFDEKTSVELGVYAIALAFGVDAREIWVATQSGATKGDAAIQHLKSRGKFKGEMIQITERALNQKFLPPYLSMRFDFQDDEQDALQSDIRNVRSQANERNVKNMIYSIRIVREQQMELGEISQAQFEQMELGDGRLLDGTELSLLFYSDDPAISPLLEGGAKLLDGINPEADFDSVKKTINKKIEEVGRLYINTKHEGAKKQNRIALAAWRWLLKQYEEQDQIAQEQELAMQAQEQAQTQGTKAPAAKKTDKPRSRVDENRPTVAEPNRRAGRTTRILSENTN